MSEDDAGRGRVAGELSPLELAIGMPLGRELGPAADREPMPEPAGLSPAAALVAAILPALARPPALVAFSGGRDSSLLMAVAVDTARRHGLPMPIPVTYRNPGAPSMEEAEWQELVLTHLGVEDWVHVTGDRELDFLGPIAQAALLRHGVRYPPNGHFLSLIGREARGGTLILGIGGDELFASWRWARRADVLARRERIDRQHLGTVLLGSAPARLRRELIRRRERPLEVRWITPQARRRLRRITSDGELQSTRWDHFVGEIDRRRVLAVTLRTLTSLTQDAGADLVLPLLDRGFRAALANAAGRHGWSSRTAAMEEIGRAHLPSAARARRTKAWFFEVYWGEASRRFATEWTGPSAFPDLVDSEALRREWLTPRPHAHSAIMLQVEWLRRQLILSHP